MNFVIMLNFINFYPDETKVQTNPLTTEILMCDAKKVQIFHRLAQLYPVNETRQHVTLST